MAQNGSSAALIDPLAPVNSAVTEPSLPRPRGPLSAAIIDYLAGRTDRIGPAVGPPCDEGPLFTVLSGDFQLALYCCYELHYRNFAGVDNDLEWDPAVLSFRRDLEIEYEAALRELVPEESCRTAPAAHVQAAIDGFKGPSLSRYLSSVGTLDQFREFIVHRSAHRLKEADTHSWGLPRFAGRSRSALVEIQMDVYGSGRPGESHAELFAATMRAAGLHDDYGYYLDQLPAITLATSNYASLLGLHRRLLPAMLGHIALVEMTSTVPMERYALLVDRFDLGDAARRFYTARADSLTHHEVVAARDLIGNFVDEHPESSSLIVWGARVLLELENHFACHLLANWSDDRTSLLIG